MCDFGSSREARSFETVTCPSAGATLAGYSPDGAHLRRLRRSEVDAALQAQTERRYAGLQLRNPDRADRRAAETQVAEPFGDTGIRDPGRIAAMLWRRPD